MDIKILDPTAYPGWDRHLLKSGNTHFFHTRAWASVLKESYGYKPVYFSLSEEGLLAFLLPCTEVNSLFTGRHGVSLPFSDLCPPFAKEKGILPSITKQILEYGKQANWRYWECRAGENMFPGQSATVTYLTHNLYLSRSDQEIFSCLDASTRRNIKKAEKSGLSIEIDDSLDSLKQFYRLNCLTRKRLGFPSQPFSFFLKIHEHVISQGYGIVLSAFLSKRCVASSIYFTFGEQAMFKFGASDLRHQSLRPNNLVMWEAIRWLNAKGFQTLNFGRTNIEDKGLLRFKRNWGTAESQIGYYRYDLEKTAISSKTRTVNLHRNLFRIAPIPILRLIGRLAYRHLG